MEKYVTLLCYNDNNEIETIKTDIVAKIKNNKLDKKNIDDIFNKYHNIKIIEDKIWENNDKEVICRASTKNVGDNSVIIGCYLYYYNEVIFVPLHDDNEKYNNINYMTPILNYYKQYYNHSYKLHITDISNMFKDSSLKQLDLSKFDTSNVTNMSHMFSGCKSLTNLNLSKFDTSKVTDMSHMFSGCKLLTPLDVSNFNISNVIDMSDMFCDYNNVKITIAPKFLTKYSDLSNI